MGERDQQVIDAAVRRSVQATLLANQCVVRGLVNQVLVTLPRIFVCCVEVVHVDLSYLEMIFSKVANVRRRR